jgi:hypothetical protein
VSPILPIVQLDGRSAKPPTSFASVKEKLKYCQLDFH